MRQNAKPRCSEKAKREGAHHDCLGACVLHGASRGVGARERGDSHTVGAQAADEIAADKAAASGDERALQRRGGRLRHGVAAARRVGADEGTEAPHLAAESPWTQALDALLTRHLRCHFIAAASAAMCAGPTPQQPPTMVAPAAIQSAAKAAYASGVSSGRSARIVALAGASAEGSSANALA